MVEYSREEKYSRPNNVKELLKIALHKERGAFGFYEDMLKHSFAQVPSIADMLNKLREAEATHIKIIEKKLAEIEQQF